MEFSKNVQVYIKLQGLRGFTKASDMGIEKRLNFLI